MDGNEQKLAVIYMTAGELLDRAQSETKKAKDEPDKLKSIQIRAQSIIHEAMALGVFFSIEMSEQVNLDE